MKNMKQKHGNSGKGNKETQAACMSEYVIM